MESQRVLFRCTATRTFSSWETFQSITARYGCSCQTTRSVSGRIMIKYGQS